MVIINPHTESYFEVVVTVRSFDEEFHQTTHYKLVTELNHTRSPIFGYDPTTLEDSGRPVGSRNVLEFVSSNGKSDIEAVITDQTIAEPNLDLLLPTFTKAQRIQIAKDYVDDVEERLGDFVKEFGPNEIRAYLDVCYPVYEKADED